MPAIIPSTLPIIDIAPYLRNDSAPETLASRKATSEALHKACVEYGFFYLDLSAYVDPQVPEELSQLARQFFALPQEEKDKLALANEDHARG